MRQTISAWRKANPSQRYVSNVHFDDVAVVRGKSLGRHGLIESDGLLAPLDKAVQESESLRLLAERGVYLMQRMPPLLLAQTRYVVHEQISPEQIDGLLDDFSGISHSVQGAERTVAALPAVIAQERRALFQEWDQRHAAINATLDRVAPSLNAGKGLTDDVKQAIATLQQITHDYPETGRVLNETISRIKDLMIYMDSQPASDLTPKIEALRLLASIGGQVNQLATHSEKLQTDRLRDIMRATYTDLLNEILWRILAFAAVYFALLFAYRFAERRYLR